MIPNCSSCLNSRGGVTKPALQLKQWWGITATVLCGYSNIPQSKHDIQLFRRGFVSSPFTYRFYHIFGHGYAITPMAWADKIYSRMPYLQRGLSESCPRRHWSKWPPRSLITHVILIAVNHMLINVNFIGVLIFSFGDISQLVPDTEFQWCGPLILFFCLFD